MALLQTKDTLPLPAVVGGFIATEGAPGSPHQVLAVIGTVKTSAELDDYLRASVAPRGADLLASIAAGSRKAWTNSSFKPALSRPISSHVG